MFYIILVEDWRRIQWVFVILKTISIYIYIFPLNKKGVKIYDAGEFE